MTAPIDLKRVTNARLVKILELRRETQDRAFTAIFTAANADGTTKWQTAYNSLATDHPTRVAYDAASDALFEAKYEGHRRVGPTDWMSTLLAYLSRSPRYVPNF